MEDFSREKELEVIKNMAESMGIKDSPVVQAYVDHVAAMSDEDRNHPFKGVILPELMLDAVIEKDGFFSGAPLEIPEVRAHARDLAQLGTFIAVISARTRGRTGILQDFLREWAERLRIEEENGYLVGGLSEEEIENMIRAATAEIEITDDLINNLLKEEGTNGNN